MMKRIRDIFIDKENLSAYLILSYSVLSFLVIYYSGLFGLESTYRFVFRILFQILPASLLLILTVNTWIKRKAYTFYDILFMVFFSYCVFVIVCSGWGNEELVSFNYQNIRILLWYLFFYIVGLNYNGLSPRFSLFFSIGVFLIGLAVLIQLDYSTFMVSYESFKSISSSVHILLGDSLAFLVLIYFGNQPLKKRIYLYLGSLILLFIIGSRSSFYIFILIGPLLFFEFLKARMSVKQIIWLYIMILVFTCIAVVVISFTELSNHRMFQIITGNDLSLNWRIIIMEKNMPDVFSNWFLGDYAGFFRHEAPARTYIHNLLSYWQQFGLLPFVMFLFFLFKAIQNIFRKGFNDGILYLTVFSVLSVLFTRAYVFVLIWFVFGYYSSRNSKIDFRK